MDSPIEEQIPLTSSPTPDTVGWNKVPLNIVNNSPEAIAPPAPEVSVEKGPSDSELLSSADLEFTRTRSITDTLKIIEKIKYPDMRDAGLYKLAGELAWIASEKKDTEISNGIARTTDKVLIFREALEMAHRISGPERKAQAIDLVNYKAKGVHLKIEPDPGEDIAPVTPPAPTIVPAVETPPVPPTPPPVEAQPVVVPEEIPPTPSVIENAPEPEKDIEKEKFEASKKEVLGQINELIKAGSNGLGWSRFGIENAHTLEEIVETIEKSGVLGKEKKKELLGILGVEESTPEPVIDTHNETAQTEEERQHEQLLLLDDKHLIEMGHTAFDESDENSDIAHALEYFDKMQDETLYSSTMVDLCNYLMGQRRFGDALTLAEKIKDPEQKEKTLQVINLTRDLPQVTPIQPEVHQSESDLSDAQVESPPITQEAQEHIVEEPNVEAPQPEPIPVVPEPMPVASEPPPEFVPETPEQKMERLKQELETSENEYVKELVAWQNQVRKDKKWWGKIVSDLGILDRKKPESLTDEERYSEPLALAEAYYIQAKKRVMENLFGEAVHRTKNIVIAGEIGFVPHIAQETYNEAILERAIKQREIFEKKKQEEINKINHLLPERAFEKNIVTKALGQVWDKYKNLTPGKKLLISTSAATVGGLAFGTLGAATAVGYAGYRVARGGLGLVTGQGIGKITDKRNEKVNQERKEQAKQEYATDIDLDNFDKKEEALMSFADEQLHDKKSQRTYKAALQVLGGGAVALSGSWAMHNVMPVKPFSVPPESTRPTIPPMEDAPALKVNLDPHLGDKTIEMVHSGDIKPVIPEPIQPLKPFTMPTESAHPTVPTPAIEDAPAIKLNVDTHMGDKTIEMVHSGDLKPVVPEVSHPTVPDTAPVVEHPHISSAESGVGTKPSFPIEDLKTIKPHTDVLDNQSLKFTAPTETDIPHPSVPLVEHIDLGLGREVHMFSPPSGHTLTVSGMPGVTEIAHDVPFGDGKMLALDSQFQDGVQYTDVRNAFVRAFEKMNLLEKVGKLVLPVPFEGGKIHIIQGVGGIDNQIKILLNGKEIARGMVGQDGGMAILDRDLHHGFFSFEDNVYERALKFVTPALKSLKLVPYPEMAKPLGIPKP